MQARYSRV